MSKRLNKLSKYFHCPVATLYFKKQTSFQTSDAITHSEGVKYRQLELHVYWDIEDFHQRYI